MRGLDQESIFAFDSAAALYRRASQADPSFLPAFLDHLFVERQMGNPMPFREEIARRADLSEADRVCLITVAKLADNTSPAMIGRFKALRSQYGATPCLDYGLSKALKSQPIARQKPDPMELSAARAVSRLYPGQREIALEVISALARLERFSEAADFAEAAAQRSPHILHRLRLDAHAAHMSLYARDTARARALMDASEERVRRDGRGWVFLQYYQNSTPLRAIDETRWQALAAEQVLVGRRSGLRLFAAGTAIDAAGPMVEGGRMTEALALLQPHAAWVEANDLPALEIRLRYIEGRALVRSGRERDAIPRLQKSLAAARRVGNVQYVAEAYHQLTHAYEGLADWELASRVARQFIVAAQETPDPGIRVISYHDAAAIHWKAGQHASSDSLSRMMVAAIEREGTQFAFAAEYFEQIGDLGTAMRYLHRAAQPNKFGHVADVNVLLAAQTRLHLALGNTDSALATARRHDSLRTISDETLVPRVLVARGEARQAVEAMRRWSALQAERGNVRGQIRALVTLAETLLPVAPVQAEEVAREVEGLATTHAFVAERMVAIRTRGEALHRSGRSAEAEPVLERARALAMTHPDAMHRILTEIALGEARLALGKRTGALGSFGAAARLIRQTAMSATDDVTLSRFRAARSLAFDGGLRAVLAGGRPSVDSLLAWSSRKKSPNAAPTRLAVSALRSRLGRGEALVDYVVVDSSIVATVVTGDAATAHVLPLSAPQALGLARRTVRAFTAVYAGRVDLARAPFDAEAARALYRGLLSPLLPRLNGITHLIVVPDAPLHLIPFDALVASDSGVPVYAIDRFTIRYALSPLAPLAPARPLSRGAQMLLVVGDAPGSSVERELIARTWTPLDVLEGGNATEMSMAAMGRRYDVLHVASHARSDDRDPLASYLSLTRDEQNDGLLHYAEIERAGVPYALVMLNACETSTGALLTGSGFMSLARAFLVSGTSSVIATQWPVGAASAQLSGRFYERARQGAPLHVALHDAKLALRRDPATSHPFFWASHVLLQGN